jgi:hypothetical protein
MLVLSRPNSPRAGYSVVASLALAAALVVLTACSSSSPADGAATEPLAQSGAASGAVTFVDAVSAQDRGDAYELLSAEVRGDSLQATVRYGGGCRDHQFRLLVSRAFRESFPVQATAALAHAADGDNCKALLTRTVGIDLAPLKAAYQAAYKQQKGTIALLLLGADRTLTYSF